MLKCAFRQLFGGSRMCESGVGACEERCEGCPELVP